MVGHRGFRENSSKTLDTNNALRRLQKYMGQGIQEWTK